MLLLMAIHFHSNQLSAICELVCSTLGMKVSAECVGVFVCVRVCGHSVASGSLIYFICFI